jgi:hypothetical protein
MTPVVINGVTVDMDDPCAVAKELRKAELILVSGGGVIRTRFGNDEVQWSTTNLGSLRELISRYDRECLATNGCRTRYAKRVRFVR